MLPNMRAFALLRSLLFGVLFMSLWTYFVPRWLRLPLHQEGILSQPAPRWLPKPPEAEA